jgi:hypothetical protein
MIERYTADSEIHSIYADGQYVDVSSVCKMLNDRDRLAAEVATLRELLREAHIFVPMYGGSEALGLSKAIDAALTTHGETP